jgi:hypothetical protein
MCGISTWEEHTGEQKWEVLGWRGLSKVVFALAVPEWHRTVHLTIFYRNNEGVTITIVRILATPAVV